MQVNRQRARIISSVPNVLATSASERREGTLQVLSHRDELAQLQSELMLVRRELIEKSESLEKQKIQRLEELGMIVHGLRNSANSILSATEYLIEDAANVLTDGQMTLLRGATQSTLSILQMLERVADFSKFENL
jgi:hypothetical protein